MKQMLFVFNPRSGKEQIRGKSPADSGYFYKGWV